MISLTHLGVIQVYGEQAAEFLQGQLTCDVRLITNGKSCLAACCNPQGRIIASFYFFNRDHQFYFLVPRDMMDITITHLMKYAVFSQVELRDVTKEWSIVGGLKREFENEFHVEIPGTERGILVLESGFEKNHFSSIEDSELANWFLQDIHDGIVLISPITSEKYLPQILNYEKLGAVSFKKGCYVGQEIIARTQHLGKLKRHLYSAVFQAPKDALQSLTIENENKQIVGEIVSFVEDSELMIHALLVLQSEIVAISQQLTFQIKPSLIY